MGSGPGKVVGGDCMGAKSGGGGGGIVAGRGGTVENAVYVGDGVGLSSGVCGGGGGGKEDEKCGVGLQGSL